MTMSNDERLRKLGYLLLNFTLPIITTLVDSAVHKQNNEYREKISKNYIKTPALLGAGIGFTIGVAMCCPNGFMSEFGIDKMSDLFPQVNGTDGFSDAESIMWNAFLCLLTIAAATLICKAIGANIGAQAYVWDTQKIKTKSEEDVEIIDKSVKKIRISGLIYGFFGTLFLPKRSVDPVRGNGSPEYSQHSSEEESWSDNPGFGREDSTYRPSISSQGE